MTANGFFDMFQLAALAFFLFVFGGRTLYMRFAKGINPITLGAGKAGFQRVVELSLFGGLAAWIVEVLLYAFHSEFRVFPAPFDAHIIDWTAARLLGAIMITVGLVVFLWALVSFGTSWRVGIDEKKYGELVTSGIFAFSRNPIFVFLDVYFIGTFLMNGTLIFLIFATVVVAGLHYQIIQEEDFLVRTYGRAYEEYRARTGRYFRIR